MSRLITALVLLITISLTQSLTCALGEDAARKCVNMADGFSIEVPPDWQVQENPEDKRPFAAFRPRRNEEEIIFERVDIIVEEIPGVILDSFCQDHIKAMKKLQADFSLLEEGETKISELPARCFLYTDTERFITLQVKAKVKQYIVVAGDKVYLLTCRATVETYPDYEETFDKIGGSFKITK